VSHSARHRASRHGVLRRRVQPRGTGAAAGRPHRVLRRGPAAAALAVGIGVIALASSPSAAAYAIRPGMITPAAAAAAQATQAAAARRDTAAGGASAAAGAGAGRTGAAARGEAPRTARATGPRGGRRDLAVVVDCARHPVVSPRALVITCADGGSYLTRLRWMSWTSVAFGHGVAHINDCSPSCAAGHVRAYRVLVTLWRAAPRAGQRGLRFTRLTERYTGWRPVEFTPAGRRYRPQTVTWRL
jgi:hypothetical protein